MFARRESRMLTLTKILTLPSLKGTTVATCPDELTRPVLSANVMAVPDIATWAQPGDFLIATGFLVSDHSDRWHSLIKKLVDIGVATLAFTLGTPIPTIPTSLIEAAQEQNFPILQLPATAMFSHIVFEIVEAVLNDRYTKDFELINVLHTPSDQELPAVLRTISDHFQRPIGLFSPDGALIAGHSLSDLPMHNKDNRVSLAPASAAHMLSIPGPTRQASLILTIGPSPRGLTPSSQGDVYSIRNIVSAILTRQEIQATVEQKYRDMFLRDWFNGHHYEPRELASWSMRLGIELPRHYRLVSITSSHADPLWEAFIQIGQIDAHFLATGTFMGEDILVVEEADKAPGPMRQLIQSLEGLNIGYSARHSHWSEITVAIQEARTSRAVAEKQQSSIVIYDELGADLILYALGTNPQIAAFCQSLLKPLVQYDQQNNAELVRTLKTFLECRRIKDTAIRLFTHYNTVLYRLGRIQEILSVDLNNPETQFQFQLAIRSQTYVQ